MRNKQIVALNSQTIINAIPVSHLQQIYRIEVLNNTSSTNDYLADKYASSPKVLAICLAEQQATGKGTHNRMWKSPAKKGIYLSFTWQISNANMTSSPVSIVIGAAVAAMLNNYQLEHEIVLKWPNDLYANGKKLGGILIESYAQTQNTWHVVIGIGINIHSDPILASENAIALADLTTDDLDRNIITAAIIDTCINFLTEANTSGLANIFYIWNKHDMLRDQTISIIAGDTKYTGKNLGICKEGKLNILVQNCTLKFSQAKIIEY